MKKPDRYELYRVICTQIGVVPKEASMGYFSREEMLELFTYLEHMDRVMKQIEALKRHPALLTATTTGKIKWPTGLKD